MSPHESVITRWKGTQAGSMVGLQQSGTLSPIRQHSLLLNHLAALSCGIESI